VLRRAVSARGLDLGLLVFILKIVLRRVLDSNGFLGHAFGTSAEQIY
jgi:hypothetical protein